MNTERLINEAGTSREGFFVRVLITDINILGLFLSVSVIVSFAALIEIIPRVPVILRGCLFWIIPSPVIRGSKEFGYAR